MITKSVRAALVAAPIAVLFALPAAAAPTYSDMIVFGDSLSDTGNIEAIFGTSRIVRNEIGYGANGRFSNGAVWHEYLADRLGIARATESRRGGTNYAHGGADTDFEPWPRQGTLYQGYNYLLSNGGQAEADALYVAWTGGNDVRDLTGTVGGEAVIDARLADFGSLLDDLVAGGARSILIPNLPDIGRIPEFSGDADAASATALTLRWNAGLDDLAGELALNAGVDVFHFDVFSIFNDILTDPAAFGFTNSTGTCRDVTFLGLIETTCRDADRFVFWDEVHPTTAAHSVLGWNAFDLLSAGGLDPLRLAFAEAPLAAVPAPAGLALAGLGLFGLGLARRKPGERRLSGS